MFEDITKVVLVTDLDGTLLTSEKKITEADFQAIRRFRDLGGRFTVATGRTVQTFEQYRAMLDINMPVIMYNGAGIYDYEKKRFMYTRPLPNDAKSYAEDVLGSMEGLGGEVLKTDGTYVFRNTDYQKLHVKLCNIVPNYCELSEIPDGDWLKVLFAMAPEDVPYLEMLARNKHYSGVGFVRTADILYEMLPEGVSKGAALAKYRELEGMEDCTFVAVGDFDNDIEMLTEADLGACPSNAEDSVKSKADLVLDNSNDTGAIEELIGRIIEKNKD